MSKRLTQEEFETRLKEINPDIKILGTYINSYMPVECKCLKCGLEWKTSKDSLFANHGCPRCADRLKPSTEEFQRQLSAKNPNLKVLSEYINSRSRIKCECTACGHIWEPGAADLIRRARCPECSDGRKECLTHEEFVENFKKRNPHHKNIEFLEEYTGAKTNIKCKCKVCGHEWDIRSSTLTDIAAGCPKCAKALGASYSEIFIFYSLYYILKGKEEVVQGDTNAIGEELDIYLPERKFAIEIGNWYYHKDKFDKDLEKCELCKKNNIELMVIYDKYEDGRELPENFYIYPNYLPKEKSHQTLKEIVYMILDKLNIEYKFTDDDWKNIEENLYYESDRLKLERFIKDFEAKNSHSDTIEILSEHFTPNSILCRCKTCGREWTSNRHNLLRGGGCKMCSGKAAWEKCKNAS